MVGLPQEVVPPMNGDGLAIPHHTLYNWILHFHTELNDVCVVFFSMSDWLLLGDVKISFYSLPSQDLPAIDCFANSEPPAEKYWKPLWEVLGGGFFGTWRLSGQDPWLIRLPSFWGSRIWKRIFLEWMVGCDTLVWWMDVTGRWVVVEKKY